MFQWRQPIQPRPILLRCAEALCLSLWPVCTYRTRTGHHRLRHVRTRPDTVRSASGLVGDRAERPRPRGCDRKIGSAVAGPRRTGVPGDHDVAVAVAVQSGLICKGNGPFGAKHWESLPTPGLCSDGPA
eukprot:840427-Prymnesium_polylepis.1